MNRLKSLWSVLFILILFILILAPQLSFGQGLTEPLQADNLKPPGTVQTDFFPVSVWYSGGKARAPMLSTITPESEEQWLQDLRQIKSLGFNTVRTWVEWSHTEPREDEYNFENLHLLLSLAQDVGLKVFIQMYVDFAPVWVGKKYGKDALYQDRSGHVMVPQAAPGYSIDHPGVRKEIVEFFRKTAKVAIQYPNFYGWDIWSEPHIINWASMPWVENPIFGFNPHTQERFRRWLKEKYGETVFIGSYLGLANQTLSEAADKNYPFLANLIQWAGVQLPFTTSQAEGEKVQVSLQKNENTGDYLLFIINHSGSEEDISVALNLEYLGLGSLEEISLSELISNEQLQKSPSNDTMTIYSELAPKGVEAWHIQAH